MRIQQLQQCFNKSQQCSTFVDQQKLNDVEPCIIRLSEMRTQSVVMPLPVLMKDEKKIFRPARCIGSA